MLVTAGVTDRALAVREKLRGKIGQTKVKRYWPGKAPEWTDDGDEDGDIKMTRADALEKAFPALEDSDVVRKDDRRLRRLAESKIDDCEEVRADHRRIRQAEIISTEEEETRRQEWADMEEQDEEALEERRRRIKEKSRLREQEEAVLPPVEEEDTEEHEEEVSDYETDSEDEMMGMAMVKPILVPKAERETIAERERLQDKERALEEKEKRRLEERKVQTKQILVEEIQKEELIQKNLEMEASIADVDTDDEVNEAEEYEVWKVREIARIKRDREAREAIFKDKEEAEKYRNMTEEEKREWDRKNPKQAPAPKQKLYFLQTYYHKGVFFQDNPDDLAATAGTYDIYKCDYSAPTGGDKVDKSIFPKVMQVRGEKFGLSGRTKWTHLVNEDTTDWNSPISEY